MTDESKSFSDTLFEGKVISDSSKNLYLKNLVRLNDNKEIKNLNFLKDFETIQKKLDALKQNTRRTYIIAIVSLLKTQPKMKKNYDQYYPLLENLNAELKTSNEKTPKEIENWCSQETIKNKFEELKSIIPELTNKKKITEIQYNKLLDLVILGLYVLQQPRRNLDYQDMLVTTQKVKVLKGAALPEEPEEPEPVKTEPNILNLNDNRFEFNNYKTKGTYAKQSVPIDYELRQIIDLYLKFHPLAKEMKKVAVPFIVSLDGKPFLKTNDFTRILNRIFGKKIGVSMLRKIFLTDKYKASLDDLKQSAAEMGTSASTIQAHYIKV